MTCSGKSNQWQIDYVEFTKWFSKALGAWAGGKLKECCPDIILLACWRKMPPLSSISTQRLRLVIFSIDFERARFLLFRVAGFQKWG